MPGKCRRQISYIRPCYDRQLFYKGPYRISDQQKKSFFPSFSCFLSFFLSIPLSVFPLPIKSEQSAYINYSKPSKIAIPSLGISGGFHPSTIDVGSA